MAEIISEWSPTSQVTTNGTQPPAGISWAPFQLTIEGLGNTGFEINFTSADGPTHFATAHKFEYEVALTSAFPAGNTQEIIAQLDYQPSAGFGKAYITGLTPGTTYYVRARWIGNDGT
jgi:hypothetical protein